MDDERIATSGFVVTPDAVASRTFTTAFRGFDQGEVRAFLKRVSEELGGAAEREAQLRRMLQDARDKAAHPEVDEEVLTNALGETAARLLASAREQAAAIRSQAEGKAARMMRETEAQISRIRSEADSLLARRVDEVDGVTANLRNAAEADARALREQVKAEVEAEILSARNQGREMVAEARAARERILTDLARRRHLAEVQVDQLRAARERLLDALAVVRRTLDESTEELKRAEDEARQAAEDVGRRAPEPPVFPADVGATPGRGMPAVRTATALRPSRVDMPPRPEPRLRPPGRPDDTGPTRQFPPLREPVAPAAAAAATGAAPAPAAARLPEAPAPPPPPPPPPAPFMSPRPVPPPPPPPPPAVVEPAETEEPTWPALGPDRVDELFARIKADRAAAHTAPPPPAPPIPAPAASTFAPPAPPTIEPPPPPPPPPAPAPEDVAPPAAAAVEEPVSAAEAAEATEATEAIVPAPASPAEDAPPPVADAAQPHHIADEQARGQRDELLDPVEEALARQLKRVLQDEQNEVLDRLRRKRRRQNGSPLLSPDEQAGRFREAAEPVLEDAVRAGAQFANPRAESPNADAGAGREVALGLARAIAEPLRKRLEAALEDAPPTSEKDKDRDNTELSEMISGVYRQWRAQDLEPLVRHHVAVAFGRGAYAAYADEASLRWVVDDEAPCPDCDDNALAGTLGKGQPYPTGQLHPPAHPGCRCLLVPAIS